ncbi:head maturation protease, ClpP-related [Leeuwenhoekiella nanhaiensis]|uniref:ATP-dependent Clp protease proteolytic subunit n=1 Tax=Leeuwenhoekiella nanhaiensis TaxID=1655491 RepID=A0A2G1VLR6_9FLAO|nr:head maturation protease, ClpP-related [Leeuwenhoekiella nanhaiensis]PHQ27705.1 hypothetical protein CJ305_18740 [Leeuwenhoekiella nanhaiensis]
METAHIYIYGEIGWIQDKNSSEYGIVTLSDVKRQYDAQKDCKDVKVHIHTIGGVVWEGFAIHDFLRSLGKPITTVIEGVCYSIGTVISLAGDTRIMTSNSEFMIHMPWGMVSGESADIQKYADSLKKDEHKAADFYAAKTKITKEEALELMKVETFMTPEETLEKGFITEIAIAMRAVAKYKPKSSKMSKKDDNKKKVNGLMKSIEGAFNKFFGNDGAPQLKMVVDANGVEIDFTELEEDDTPAVGDKATIDGAAAEGEHVMPSGETYVFAAGSLTEIKPADEGGDDSEEMQQLQTENAQLKKDLAAEKKAHKALQKANKKLESDTAATKKMVETMQADFKKLKKSIGSDFDTDPKNRKDPEKTTKSRKVFKDKE